MNSMFPNLFGFNCDNNNLTSLPDNMNFPNLTHFYCHNNKLFPMSDNKSPTINKNN